jgi:uncharacterized protein HemX
MRGMTVDEGDLEVTPVAQAPDAGQQPEHLPRLPDGWRRAMLVCAVIVAIGVAFIAYQEVQQTRFQRRSDCFAKTFAESNGTSDQSVVAAQRRCFGLEPRPSTTAPD